MNLQSTPVVTLQHADQVTLDRINSQLKNQKPFRAGALAEHYDNWLHITSDSNILNSVKGFTLDIIEIPQQHSFPNPLKTSSEEVQIASALIK